MLWKKKKTYEKPLISVCIPVYNTEKYLQRCLDSIIEQDFPYFEVIVVSDGSGGKSDEGYSARKIVRLSQKKANIYRRKNSLPLINLSFYENSRNLGTVETRRVAFFYSIGEYITYIDSDDVMIKGALKALYSKSGEFDIVQGDIYCGRYEDSLFCVENDLSKWRNFEVFHGDLKGHDVFSRWFVNWEYSCVLWGKLVKRELYQKAYDSIPFIFCCYSDDILTWFFVSLYANSYTGINAPVINYVLDTGVSDKSDITDLKTWKIYCTKFTALTVINDFIENNKKMFSKLEKKSLRALNTHGIEYISYLLTERVSKDLQKDAYRMLCEFCGKENVDRFVREF